MGWSNQDSGGWAGSGSGGAYTAHAVTFPTGLTVGLATGLTGAADGKVGTASFWIKPAGDGTTMRLLQTTASSGLVIDKSSANGITVAAFDTASTINLDADSTATNVVAAGGWKHVLASWNLATGVVQIAIEDVVGTTITTATNSNISYATGVTQWYAPNASSFPSNCDIADLWIDFTTFNDLTVTANRRKFISASLAPVDLGATGQLPTGTSPVIFFRGPSATWPNNAGTGGAFSILGGTLVDAGSNPP